MMIAVTGANGALGQLVVKSLLEQTQASEIVGLVRDPENVGALSESGITLRKADYNEAESLLQALQGVEKLLLISSNAIGSRVSQHKAVIDAAKTAGVKVLVYTSVLKADSNPMILAKEHKPTEEYLKASGLSIVILRNGWYTENYIQGITGILDSGTVFGAAQEGKFNTAARADYAQAAANVLTSPEEHLGKTYELAGDESFTLAEFAAEIGKQTGKDIAFNNMAEEDFRNLLVNAGLPEGFATALADSEVYAAQGYLEDTSGTLSKLLGRGTTSLATSISQAL